MESKRKIVGTACNIDTGWFKTFTLLNLKKRPKKHQY